MVEDGRHLSSNLVISKISFQIILHFPAFERVWGTYALYLPSFWASAFLHFRFSYVSRVSALQGQDGVQ